MRTHKGWHRVGATLLIAGAGFLALLLLLSRRAEAGVQVLSQTTLADFSAGEFLRTGLAGMGDGAVSLLRAGLSGEWITTVVTAGLVPRWGHAAVYTNGRIYVIGGLHDATVGSALTRSIVQSATVLGDHNLTPWVTVTTNLTGIFPQGTAYGGAAQVGSFLYVIGGRRAPNPDFGVAQRQVAYARVNPDGSLSPFTEAVSLPVGLESMATVAWAGWIYVLGGIDENLQVTDTIYVARPDPTTGAITGWTRLTWTLPYPLWRHAAVAEQGYLYVIGGMTGTNNVESPPLYEVWFAPLGDGTLLGPFTRTEPLDNNLVELAAIGYNGLLLTSGGLQSNLSDVSRDVRAGALADSGAVITWTATSLITPPRSAHAMVVLPDGWVYVIGGRGLQGTDSIPLTHINAGRLSAEGAGLFLSSGRYLAPPFHLDRRRLLLTLDLQFLRPPGTDAAVRIRSQAQDGFPWSDWSPWTPLTGTGEVTLSIPLNFYVQSLQYEVALSTTNPLTAPFLLRADLRYEVPDKPPAWVKQAIPPEGSAVRPGDRITYTVILTNDSGATLHNLRLTDEFPAGTAYVAGSASASAGLSWTVSAGGWVGEMSALAPGSVLTFTFAVTVTAGGGQIQNQAVLQTDEFGLLAGNVVVHPVTALTGTLTALPPAGSVVFPGDLLTYTLRVTNPASAPLGAVQITGQLPLAVVPLPNSLQVTAGSVFTGSWPVFRWDLPGLGAGETAALTWTVRITDPMWIEDGAWLTATAALSGASSLPLGAVTHVVRQPYALQIVKTDDRSQADIEEILRYTITLTNTGWVTVTDLRITDTLTGWPWITFVDPPVEAGQMVITLPALGPRATISFVRSAQISVSANLSDVVAFTNTVTARAFGATGVPLADRFEASDVTALAGPDLVAAILPGSVVFDGSTVTLTVVVTNVGPGTARPLSSVNPLCAPHWVLVGFWVNDAVYADYLSLGAHRLPPGAAASQVFTLPLTRAASIRAMVDAYALGFGFPGRGCVMETREDNNVTAPVMVGGYRVFLPLILRGP
ncbi:MAG: DUF11 domain-containing protein [Thermoflexus hugenholtzii]|uniref:DUF7507 domain-containing protein n=1 Tax=Thermoflexus TaxID=1495649 RepID=UPI001C76104B|nr:MULTISPECIES: hypothetical protein [Thermoflexus]QWK10079.1 MAG: DUF11 domain-containing protein [Thermoflexus hugenholtzii]